MLPEKMAGSRQTSLNRNPCTMLSTFLFGHKSVLTQTQICDAQILEPLENQPKSVLTQTQICDAQILEPLENQTEKGF